MDEEVDGNCNVVIHEIIGKQISMAIWLDDACKCVGFILLAFAIKKIW